eukprot:Sspe_Gene.81186::Locus_51794_Transcript_1_1_Confidence_1.000_Length_838::g.81186::m.81186
MEEHGGSWREAIDEVYDEEVDPDAPPSGALLSRGLTGNRMAALYAISRNVDEFQDVDKGLRCERSFILEAARVQGMVVRFVEVDKEVALAAVSQDASVLEYLPPEFKRDKEVVLAAAQQDGMFALQLADPYLCSDKEVVLAAVQQCGLAVEYAAPHLLCDSEVISAARQHPHVAHLFPNLQCG